MKNTRALTYVTLLLLISFNYQLTFSQNAVAFNSVAKLSSVTYSLSNGIVLENATLEDGKYTYKFKERDILVEIKDGIYHEHHPENEYVRAKIEWLTKFKYKLTVVSIKKQGAPLKVGSALTAEIIKIKGNEYFYTSFLNNKKGKGSFKKIE